MSFIGDRTGMAAYAAPSLFQPHRARDAIRDAYEGKIRPLMGYYAGLASIPTIRYMAPMGFDAVWIDWEHSACNIETMTTMVHEISFMSGGKTIPFVRLPGHDHASIAWALDAGASLIVPQVDTVEQAKHVISYAKYGTANGGVRSAPPYRFVPGLTDTPVYHNDIHKSVNDQAAIMIQIESLQGIKNLDAILTACPEIDIVWLGTIDCRISMNLPANGGLGGTEPEWVEAFKLYNDTMIKHDKPRGGFAIGDVDFVNEACNRLTYITVAADTIQLGGMLPHIKGIRDTAKGIDKRNHAAIKAKEEAKAESKVETAKPEETKTLEVRVGA